MIDPIPWRYRIAKRAVDTVCAAAGLIMLSPVLAVIALGVKRSSPGPAIHCARRVGRDGELFTLYKFRTMRVGARAQGPGVTVSGDPRITRIGAMLRRTKLDELPQLLNVVRGDMSLVGPRPEDPRYLDSYTVEQRQLLRLRPGITSAASLRYRAEEEILAAAVAAQGDLDAAYRTVQAEKLAFDLDHWQQPSLRADLRLMLETVRAVAGRT